jgi:hypothetical protein
VLLSSSSAPLASSSAKSCAVSLTWRVFSIHVIVEWYNGSPIAHTSEDRLWNSVSQQTAYLHTEYHSSAPLARPR